MYTWEYKILFFGSALDQYTLMEVLNDWGTSGWEFTGYAKKVPSGKNYFMKRRTPVELKLVYEFNG